jgi:hypothetical protein
MRRHGRQTALAHGAFVAHLAREELAPMPDADSPDMGSQTAAERALSPAARRALAEAAERRTAQAAREAELARQREVAGRGGLDPVRYSDWEVKGLTSDF